MKFNKKYSIFYLFQFLFIIYSKHINNKNYKIFKINNLRNIGIIFNKISFSNTFQNGYNNKINANKNKKFAYLKVF